MFIVTKRIEIAAAHKLDLPYDSPCSRLHGHNWIITVEISSEVLDSNGMVIDFIFIKEVVNKIDHHLLSDYKCPFCDGVQQGVLRNLKPTAENIAIYLYNELENKILAMYEAGKVHLSTSINKVTVQESEGNTACYIP